MWMEIWNNVFMQYNRERLDKVILIDGMYCLFDENFIVNEAILTKIRSLNARIIIVTNAPLEKMTSIREQTGLEVVTYEKNPIKTDTLYFTKMLADKGLKAEDCIYLDHDVSNLTSAKQAGITGELFENVDSIDKLHAYFYHLLNLPAQCVDTGMGIERCAVTLNGMKSVYETDSFAPVLAKIKEIVGETNYNERSARIIADHVRTATHMIADGVTPKNIDQGYILRRLIRRAIREAYKMGYEAPFTAEIASIYIEQFSPIYESVANHAEKIKTELSGEEGKFAKTLKDGVREFEKIVNGFQIAFERSGQKITQISGGKAFTLFDTYGFPLEMTVELAKEHGLTVDIDGFNVAFEKHQELSRTAAAGKFVGGLGDNSPETIALHSACHMMLAGLRKVL